MGQKLSKKEQTNPKTIVREWILQFLYQCEVEKIYHYSAPHLQQFISDFKLNSPYLGWMTSVCEGILQNYHEINSTISEHSKNWSVDRMSVVDRCILRLGCYEIQQGETPRATAINEAIELAKTFGSKDSYSFINGILDRISGPNQLT